jgi:hypothetical protein
MRFFFLVTPCLEKSLTLWKRHLFSLCCGRLRLCPLLGSLSVPQAIDEYDEMMILQAKGPSARRKTKCDVIALTAEINIFYDYDALYFTTVGLLTMVYVITSVSHILYYLLK